MAAQDFYSDILGVFKGQTSRACDHTSAAAEDKALQVNFCFSNHKYHYWMQTDPIKISQDIIQTSISYG